MKINIETLKLFNDKVEELKKSSFVPKMKSTGYKVDYTGSKPFEIKEIRKPDIEARKAFVLTLRFFVQNNERISIANIYDVYCNSEGFELQTKIIESIRTALNQQLDKPLQINPEHTGGKPITQRELFFTFLYADLSHASKKKRAIYQTWSKYPTMPALDFYFDHVCFKILQAANFIETVNLDVIAQIEQEKQNRRLRSLSRTSVPKVT